MLDIARAQINWRGYPVVLLSDGVCGVLAVTHADDLTTREGTAALPARLLMKALAAAKDTSEHDEPAGWIFETQLSGETVWIERFGGMRETDRHDGGQWSVYLPGER